MLIIYIIPPKFPTSYSKLFQTFHIKHHNNKVFDIVDQTSFEDRPNILVFCISRYCLDFILR